MLNFGHCGNNFTLKVPHHGKWISIIRFLKSRGFDIKENESYKKHYQCISKFHKIGFKKNVALLMEISASSINVEFGNIKNLWTGIAQSFWNNPNDDRYTKLNYLEDVAVRLEIKKLMAFCSKFNLTFVREEYSLNAEEYIINTLKINTHIHGNVNCLNDIKLSITPESHDWKCNSNDKNQIKIVCGQRKYFYDPYNKRLSSGIVWHHINNMWWVICGQKLYNITAYDLFDFKPGLTRRKPLDQYSLNRLLKKFSEQKDYKTCHMIQKHHPSTGEKGTLAA